MGDKKICKKCGRELPLSDFSKDKSKKDGLNTCCKECRKKYSKQWYAENREKKAEYMKQYNKQYYAENREAILEYKKQYQAENKETILEYKKQYYATLRGYCSMIRDGNISADKKYGRIGDELPNNYPTVEDYMELLQLPDFYDGKQYDFNEMGLDRIDNSLPHILSNVVPCTTKHNAQRGRMPFEEFCSLFS